MKTSCLGPFQANLDSEAETKIWITMTLTLRMRRMKMRNMSPTMVEDGVEVVTKDVVTAVGIKIVGVKPDPDTSGPIMSGLRVWNLISILKRGLDMDWTQEGTHGIATKAEAADIGWLKFLMAGKEAILNLRTFAATEEDETILEQAMLAVGNEEVLGSWEEDLEADTDETCLMMMIDQQAASLIRNLTRNPLPGCWHALNSGK